MRPLKSHYLITTGISEFWDLQKTPVLLGPWCVLSRQNKQLLAHKEAVSIDPPFGSVDKLKEAAAYCTAEYELLLPELSDNLNALHGCQHPLKYWRMLIGTWLWHLIGVLYDRQRRIKEALEKFPGVYTHICRVEYGSLATSDPFDFINNVSEDGYNLLIFSAIISRLYPEYAEAAGFVYTPKHFSKNFKSSARSRVFNALLSQLPGKKDIALVEMYHLSNLDRLMLKLSPAGGRISFFDYLAADLDLADTSLNREARGRIRFSQGRDEFSRLLRLMLPECLPKCYVEGYSDYAKLASNIKAGRGQIKILGSALGWYYNEPFKFLAASLASNGTRTADFQHGGGYGYASLMPEEMFSMEKDVFYTWGWGLREKDTVRPMPSIHLSKIKDSYKGGTDRILFVSASNPAYNYKFQSMLQPEQMRDYFADQLLFLRLLTSGNLKRVAYRPYPAERGWGEKELVKEEYPDIEIIEGGISVEWMKSSGLVVIDHPYTSFLESLVMNAPTILYWNNNIHQVRSDSLPYFDSLRKAGILYADPLSAAAKVNAVSGNPFEWWLRDEVQSSRRSFCERFAYARKDWVKMWSRELKRIAQQGNI